MTALEFHAQMNSNGTIAIPSDLAAKIPRDQTVRVLVLLKDQDDDTWEQMAADEFGRGYVDSDAIYDQFSGR